MNRTPGRRRVALAALAGLAALSTGAVAAPLAVADKSAPGSTATAREKARREHGAKLYRAAEMMHQSSVGLPSTNTVTAAAAYLTPAGLVAQINGYRARYGVGPITLVTTDTAALTAHANYIALNQATDGDLSSEEQGAPGYTDAGAAIAPYSAAIQASSWTTALAAWMSDPYFRDVQLLDSTATTIGFGSSGSIRVMSVAFSGDVPTGYPRVYPTGTDFPDLRNNASWLADDYGCAGSGQPVSGMWDYATYGLPSATSGSLKADGVPVSACPIPAKNLTAGESAMVPSAVLAPGTHYTGTIGATFDLLAGGSATVSQPFQFSTPAAATGVFGDQSGDRTADVFAVNQAGDLLMYKGTRAGALGYGWKVGSGWGSFDWFAKAGDVNKDGRTDLLARRNDGNMYLFLVTGMGGFRDGVLVGQRWSGLTAIAVVGDMNHDGLPDVVGRTSAGDLYRYNLTPTAITGGVQIGHGWNAMSFLVGPGSMNGDAYEDIVAIRNDGNLYAYLSGPTGLIVSQKQVGRRWSGWTSLFIAGDYNGDGRRDLTGRKADGTLYTWFNTGSSWTDAVQAGSGWGGMRLLA